MARGSRSRPTSRRASARSTASGSRSAAPTSRGPASPTAASSRATRHRPPTPPTCDAVPDLLARYEYKYLIDEDTASRIREVVRSYLEPDPYGDNGAYWVS